MLVFLAHCFSSGSILDHTESMYIYDKKRAKTISCSVAGISKCKKCFEGSICSYMLELLAHFFRNYSMLDHKKSMYIIIKLVTIVVHVTNYIVK